MQQGEPLTMTRAEWRKADPDTKAVEGGQCHFQKTTAPFSAV